MLATSGQSWRCYGVTSWHPRHRTCDCQRRLGEHLPPLLQGGISLKVVQAAGGQIPAPRIPVQHRQLGIPAPQSHCSANSGSIGRGLDVQRQWRPGARHRLMAGQGSDGPDASPGLQRRAGRRRRAGGAGGSNLNVSSSASRCPGALARSTAMLSTTPNRWVLASSSSPPAAATAAVVDAGDGAAAAVGDDDVTTAGRTA